MPRRDLRHQPQDVSTLHRRIGERLAVQQLSTGVTVLEFSSATGHPDRSAGSASAYEHGNESFDRGVVRHVDLLLSVTGRIMNRDRDIGHVQILLSAPDARPAAYSRTSAELAALVVVCGTSTIAHFVSLRKFVDTPCRLPIQKWFGRMFCAVGAVSLLSEREISIVNQPT